MGSFGGGGRLIVGRYRLRERLGRGGMGTVWLATDELLGRQVAVKELHLEAPDDDGPARPGTHARLRFHVRRERTMREARTVARIKHPNVIVVHDVVEQDERPWIVMEYVAGGSLADRLATGGPVAPREAARIGLALIGALRVAHARGVLHRDLRPANVLLESGTNRVVLTDFGVAQLSGAATLTETGGFVGSPEYVAPELIAGRGSGPEADLWSLGVLLCAALSGRTPFGRDSLAGVLQAVTHDEIAFPEAVRPLLGVVRGLLERDPDRRTNLAGAEWMLRAYLRYGRVPEPPAPEDATRKDGDEGQAEADAEGDAERRAEGKANGAGRAHGAPLAEAIADRALAAAARPRTGRLRTALLVGLLVAALAGLGAGVAALIAASDDDHGDRPPRPSVPSSSVTGPPASSSSEAPSRAPW
ncbi:serine/threonine-protein kinase [Streptomyces sp. NPDC003077]|uniref:serine/threonine-protein kinase n=1 Tax=Streptomyces sp. NPDC003077 TaxID=3154443 RepID=UPI0033BCAAF8